MIGMFKSVAGPTVLLTGMLGEIWYPRAAYADRPGDYLTPDLKRWDLGGHGMSEVRLAVGFVQVPVPYIGAQQRGDIAALTESPSMSGWRVGTNYDRPIPRRIAESRGVPRNAFGQRKLASVVQFAPPEVPHSPDLKREFDDYLRREGLLGRIGINLLPLVRRTNEFIRHHPKFRWYLIKCLALFGRRRTEDLQIWRRLNGALHCFAVNRRIRDYGLALKSNSVVRESSC
jgi:hypothetical protein